MKTAGRSSRRRRTWIFVLLVLVLAVFALGALLAVQLSRPAASPPHPDPSKGVSRASPPPAPLSAVACPTAELCVAVGGSGHVYVSDDAAGHFVARRVPSDHYLFSVACPTSTRCVAVGDAGTVVVSQGGLRHWVDAASGTRVPLASVTCQSPDACVAVGDGGTVISSADGGGHWKKVSTGSQVINGVACGLPGQCVAVTSSAAEVLRTIDGVHWSGAQVSGGPLVALLSMNGVACAGPTCVSVGLRGTVAYSGDGGASWSFDETQATGQTLNSVSCSTAELCSAVGASGTILATTDGGASWTEVSSPTAETLLGVTCQASGPCVAVGDGGTILSTGAATQAWTLREGAPVPPGAQLDVLVVGDSFSQTVALYVDRDASQYGVNLIDGGLDGCSLARGETIALPVGGPCAPTGPGWPAQYTEDVEEYHPALSLVVLGPWDLSARLVDGQWLSPGQPAYDSYYADQLTTAIQILSSEGGRVAVATVPYVLMTGPELCAPPPATEPHCPTEAQRVDALDRVAREVVAEHPGTATLIDLGQHLAPRGEFTPTVDGVVVRAADGVHLSESGGEWLAPWLLPMLDAADHPGGTH